LVEPSSFITTLPRWRQTSLKDLLAAGKTEIRQGSVEEATLLLELFDKYRPEKAQLVSPHLHD
jgi:hypothetical protein